MTAIRKRFWDSLPRDGTWVTRDSIDYEKDRRNRCGDFQSALSYFHNKRWIVLEFREDGLQYVRRLTIEEISNLEMKNQTSHDRSN